VNVVFMDNDIFLFKSLARIFENEDFDYGCTISDSKAMPVRLRPLMASVALRCRHALRPMLVLRKSARNHPVSLSSAGCARPLLPVWTTCTAWSSLSSQHYIPWHPILTGGLYLCAGQHRHAVRQGWALC